MEYNDLQMERFRDWILVELNKRGMTQADLARASGVTSAAISRLLSEQRVPAPETCMGIARAFNLPPEDVYRRAGLLPDTGEPDDLLTRIIANIAEKLDEGRREELKNYAEYQLRRQEQKGEYRVDHQNSQKAESTS